MTKNSGINVLLVTADQFRADCLSAAGHPLIETPALDALAEDGILFARHFSQGTPCGPSRTSLLTGMYQMNHRSVRNGTPLDAAFTNIAQQARRAGFDAALVGYTDTTMDPRRLDPRDPEARRYEGTMPGFTQVASGSEWGITDPDWRLRLKELGYDCWQDPYVPASATATANGPTHAPAQYKAEHSDTAYTTDRALRYLQQQGDRPWFLHVGYLRPHPPLVAPAPWHDRYRAEDVPDFNALPSLAEEQALHPFMPYRFGRMEMHPGLSFDQPPNDSLPWRQARATYYGLISELDANIGRLLQGLKDAGTYDRTLIIFTSDHGEMLGDHWCWGKELPFDQAVRVPFIIRSPFAEAGSRGRVEQHFSEHVDIMPTILDHLDLEIPLQCDGQSVRPFLEGGTPAGWRDEARWEYDFREIADAAVERDFGITIDECGLSILRTDTAKYVHFAGLPPLYFDLEKDPAELNNLAGDSRYAAPMLALAQRMLTWRMAYNRREMTGMCLKSGTQQIAARHRRIT
ncbi:MAG: alkaline phosphatase family protein [Alphaproteobacteria bacterium]